MDGIEPGRGANMDSVRVVPTADVHADLPSDPHKQPSASPVWLLQPTSGGTKGQSMEEESAVTPPGHSTEGSSPVVAPAVQKTVGTLPVQQTAEEEKRQRETNLEDRNKCSAFCGEEEKQHVIGRKDFWLAVGVFVLIGLNSLMAWNVMLNLAPYMAASYFGGQDCGNTFLACFQGACVIVQVTFIYFNCRPKALIFYVGATVNVGAFLAVTPAAAYCYRTTALVLIHLICLMWGAASGALQGAGYAYAGAFPVNFAVFVSAGQGIAGLAAFALNTLLGFVFFDLNTFTGLTNQSWVLYVICSTLSALLAVGIFSLSTRPWARQPFQTAAERQHVTKRPSQVVVRVVSDHQGGKLVGQNDEKYTQGASNALSTDFTRGSGAVKGQEASNAKWSDLTDAGNSKDTSATLLTTKFPSGLSKEQALDRSQLTSFSQPPKHPPVVHKFQRDSGSAEVDTVAKTAANDFVADLQPPNAVRADVAEQQTNDLSIEADLPTRSLLAVARVMWQPLMALVVTFFVTLNLFPRIGPVGWHYTQQVPNHFVILFGLFAVADTVGRSTPSLQMMSRRWLGWTLIPERIFVWLTFSRVVFYIPFFLSYKLENRVVLNDFWWLSCLMLLFAFTHGWFTSLGFIYAVGKVRESEKGIAGPLAVVALSLGILLGLYIALAY